jgi:hypothetical protein
MNMKTLKDYLTVKGWKSDFDSTKEDFSRFYKQSDITGIVNNEKGNAALLFLGTAALMPVCAYIGSYLGQWSGWVAGQVIDALPYVNKVAPYFAERCGHIGAGLSRHALNVQLAQTTGAIGGFWGGLFLPLEVLAKIKTGD